MLVYNMPVFRKIETRIAGYKSSGTATKAEGRMKGVSPHVRCLINAGPALHPMKGWSLGPDLLKVSRPRHPLK